MKKKIIITMMVVLLIAVLILIASIVKNKERDYNKSDFVLDNENKYKITTNSFSMTMQNDGGSHTNIYYQIDLNENKVIKCLDKYIGFEGYIYKGKILYSKNINENEKQELKLILDNIYNNSEEESKKLNDDYYILSSVNRDDVKIYDKNIIKSLQNILEE